MAACSGGAGSPVDTADEQATSPEHAIVFVGSTGDASELFGFNISDDARHQLTSLSREVGFPVWSPSGDRIAFLVTGEDRGSHGDGHGNGRRIHVSILIADNETPPTGGQRARDFPLL